MFNSRWQKKIIKSRRRKKKIVLHFLIEVDEFEDLFLVSRSLISLFLISRVSQFHLFLVLINYFRIQVRSWKLKKRIKETKKILTLNYSLSHSLVLFLLKMKSLKRMEMIFLLVFVKLLKMVMMVLKLLFDWVLVLMGMTMRLLMIEIICFLVL